MTPAQCRAARAVLNWSMDDLAHKAGLSRPTIADFERGARRPHPNNIRAIAAAFAASDVRAEADPNGHLAVVWREG